MKTFDERSRDGAAQKEKEKADVAVREAGSRAIHDAQVANYRAKLAVADKDPEADDDDKDDRATASTSSRRESTSSRPAKRPRKSLADLLGKGSSESESVARIKADARLEMAKEKTRQLELKADRAQAAVQQQQSLLTTMMAQQMAQQKDMMLQQMAQQKEMMLQFVQLMKEKSDQ